MLRSPLSQKPRLDRHSPSQPRVSREVAYYFSLNYCAYILAQNHIRGYLSTTDMEGEENIVAQVQRFEDYCLRKRSLERDIELVLTRRDNNAVEAVERAENELQHTKRECAKIRAHVERARELESDRAEKPRLPLDIPLQIPSNTAKEGAVSQAATDSHSFSVVSDQQLGAAGMRMDQRPSLDPSSHTEDDLSNEFLTRLAQRYTDICHERRMLQEEIEDRLERKERMAAEKVRCATIALEATRQKTVELVAALNEASQGDSKVNLPARSVRSTTGPDPGFPDAGGVHASGWGPIAVSPLVTGPDPVQAGEHSVTVPPPDQASLQPSSTALQHHSSSVGTIRSTAIDQLSQSTLRRTPATAVPPATAPSFPGVAITATQRAIYAKYDSMMVAAKAAGEAVPMPKIPWPLLMSHAHQYPMQNIMVQHLESPSVINFFQGYIQWKGWNLKVESRSILIDWTQLYSQVPDYKRGGRLCVEKVVSILRGLLQN